LLWIEKAKNEITPEQPAFAGLALHEIPLRMLRGESEAANELINELVRHHGRNEQVMRALQGLFVQLGILNPDGTPTAVVTQQQNKSVNVADVQPAASKLWVPD
ncbi:MAG: hypothetical protein LBN39_05890, partial [Planctomycetaceae bacterium]|nr:hypothetical protein [Planctomycetaceae bacterium]